MDHPPRRHSISRAQAAIPRSLYTPPGWKLAHRAVLVAGLSLFPVVASMPRLAHAQLVDFEDSSFSGEASHLFRRGNDRLKKGRVKEAHALYSASWEIVNYWGTAANLGKCEFDLGRTKEAVWFLKYALERWPDGRKADQRKAAQELFDKARTKVGIIDVVTDVPGATVYVDRAFAGRSPIENSLVLDPGPHDLKVASAEHGEVSRSLRVEPGQEYVVKLLLREGRGNLKAGTQKSPRGSASKPSTDTTTSSGSTKFWVLGGGAGLTVLAATGALVFGQRGRVAGEEHSDLVDQLTSSGATDACASLNPPAVCGAIADKADLRNRMHRTEAVLWVSSAVLGGATVATYFLWPEDDAASVIPSLSADHAGLVWKGTF